MSKVKYAMLAGALIVVLASPVFGLSDNYQIYESKSSYSSTYRKEPVDREVYRYHYERDFDRPYVRERERTYIRDYDRPEVREYNYYYPDPPPNYLDPHHRHGIRLDLPFFSFGLG